MTVKLNLSKLVKHFTNKDVNTAKQLYNLTKQAQETPFESAFLTHQDLKSVVDNLDKKSTLEQFNDAKASLGKSIKDSEQFSTKEKLRHLSELQKISSAAKLQAFFYNYILAAEKLKVVSNLNNNHLKKVAEVLVEIADQLDQEQPELAREADLLLEELTKTAAQGCGNMEMDHVHTESCMRPRSEMLEAVIVDEEGKDDYLDHASHQEVLEPNIEDIVEPEPEYDHVSLEDLNDRLENMRFRVADKHRREMLEKAIEHANKAKQYHEAYKRYKDKTHSIFDDAGEAFRLKDFD